MLSEVSLSSGLLPGNTLWWNQGSRGPEIALWRAPQVWPVALQMEAFKPPERYHLPMPGLIFVCRPGSSPTIYAAKKRPVSRKDNLYHAPLFNVFTNGSTCPGTHKFPDNVDEIPESFFTSFFTATADWRQRSKKYPGDLARLWRELDGKPKYPMRDLVYIAKVEEIVG